MLKHIVMWKLKEFALENTKEKNALIIKERLEALKGEIKEIINIEVGLDVIHSSASYDLVLYSEFLNQQALEIYAKHPSHVKVAEFINQVRTERIVVDYIV